MTEIDQQLLEVFKEEAEDLLDQWESACIELRAGLDEETLKVIFRNAHTLKGSSRAVGLEEFGQYIHKIEDLIKAAQSEQVSDVAEFVKCLLDAHSIMSEWLDSGDAPNKVAKSIEDASGLLNGQAISASQSTIDTSSAQKQARQPQKKNAASNNTKDEVIRVRRSRIDELIRTAGELSTQFSILAHHRSLSAEYGPQSDIALEQGMTYSKLMQELAMALSMQPLDKLFQRLERTCLDVASSSGKKLEVKKIGTDIELDKTVLDKIADPFIHIVRNASDHGVEDPSTRQAVGKPELGVVTLKAEQDAGTVKITVGDDGKGLDAEKIRAKALEKGLIEESQELSETDLYQLVLQPGFSTKDQVTDISGRGVGMDVVTSTLTNLGGSLSIESKKGAGSKFIVELPTNFSMVESIVATIQGNAYGIPVKDLAEVIDVKEVEVQKNEAGESFFLLRDQVVTLHSLANFLRDGNKQTTSTSKIRTAVVNWSFRKPMAFFVEKIHTRQSLFVKPLPSGMEGMLGVSGTTIMPDGKPGLIINLPEIVREHQKSFVGSAA